MKYRSLILRAAAGTLLLAGICLTLTHPASARITAAAPSDTFHDRHIDVSILSTVDTVVPGQPLDVAVRLQPEAGWHTYWRNPGDTGLPTRIDWTLPPGSEAGPIQWPVPERINYQGLINYGYHGETLLLSTLTPPVSLRSGSAFHIEAEVNWLICKDICIPGNGRVALTLAISEDGTATPGRWQDVIAAARARLPQHLDYVQARFHLDKDLVIDLSDIRNRIQSGETLQFFPVDKGLVDNAALPAVYKGNNRVLIRTAVDPEFQGQVPGELNGLLLAGSGDRSRGFYFQARAVTTPIPFPVTVAGNSDTSLFYILLLALAGGFILNLMPCVFPVLSIKVLSLIKAGTHDPARRRLHGIAYTAGILLSFLIFAGTLLAIRSAGESIGWGFQLQSPWFVAVLAYLLFAMGLTLSGLIEPGSGLTRVGNLLQAHGGVAGSFFNGVLATVVATPCTVPFMATAMGYALTQSAPVALGIFAVLGLGLASPFLLIAFVPALANHLPRPGHWMQTLKQLLAFPLYLSVVWLLWVLNHQTGADVLAWVLVGLVLLAFAAWLWQLASVSRRAPLWRLAALASLFAALFLLPGAGIPVNQSPRDAVPTAPTSTTVPYSKSVLADAVASGRPVFVNIGADWCITCKVNERLALRTESVQTAFARHNVLYMVGDWTNGDPNLTRVLRSFNRPGVPLYLLYLPGRDAPLVLPQLLTPDLIIDALEGRYTG
jgi:DsbC/DsbD-like thiol-disulfide interchange protein/cytochrome c biogenesis protein CcdA